MEQLTMREAAIAVIKSLRTTLTPSQYGPVLNQLSNDYAKLASIPKDRSTQDALAAVAHLYAMASFKTSADYVTSWYGEDAEAAEWSEGSDEFDLMLAEVGNESE